MATGDFSPGGTLATGAGVAAVGTGTDGDVGGAVTAGAGITGRRVSAWRVKRSAADLVRRYPAVYTARTAAELSATRVFETFLWELWSDTDTL